jgi:23S rRNA-/tRNA-specific pseudouridylate synthase
MYPDDIHFFLISGTSGILVLAKTRLAAAAFSQLFRTNQV